jgi:hypothetical protein
LQLGWLLAIHDPADIDAAALDLARSIARMSGASIAAVKHVVDVALGSNNDALVAESDALMSLMAARNHVEPMRRFPAAGGQTRDAERDDFAGVIDRMFAS